MHVHYNYKHSHKRYLALYVLIIVRWSYWKSTHSESEWLQLIKNNMTGPQKKYDWTAEDYLRLHRFGEQRSRKLVIVHLVHLSDILWILIAPSCWVPQDCEQTLGGIADSDSVQSNLFELVLARDSSRKRRTWSRITKWTNFHETFHPPNMINFLSLPQILANFIWASKRPLPWHSPVTMTPTQLWDGINSLDE